MLLSRLLGEEADPTRTDEQADDDEDDAPHHLPLDELEDASDDKNHGQDPQDECHGGYLLCAGDFPRAPRDFTQTEHRSGTTEPPRSEACRRLPLASDEGGKRWKDESAGPRFGERFEGAAVRIGTVLSQGAPDDAQVDGTDHLGVPVGCLEQGTVGQPNLVGVIARGLGSETQVVEEDEHLLPGWAGGQRRCSPIARKLTTPFLPGLGRGLRGVGVGARDDGRQGRGEPGVLGAGRFVGGQLIEPRRAATALWLGPMPPHHAATHQRGEVLTQGVLVQSGGGHQARQRQRLGLAAQPVHDRLACWRQRW